MQQHYCRAVGQGQQLSDKVLKAAAVGVVHLARAGRGGLISQEGEYGQEGGRGGIRGLLEVM